MGFSLQTRKCYLEKTMLFVTDVFFREVILGGQAQSPSCSCKDVILHVSIRSTRIYITCYAENNWFRSLLSCQTGSWRGVFLLWGCFLKHLEEGNGILPLALILALHCTQFWIQWERISKGTKASIFLKRRADCFDIFQKENICWNKIFPYLWWEMERCT